MRFHQLERFVMAHIVIIGAGVIGTTIGRALAFKKAGPITILEKEPSAGQHQSGRNSGVIHSGINQKPGSMKARMCVEGNRLLREYCRKKKVPMEECGTLVSARTEKECCVLEKLLDMGMQCEVPGLKIITQKELKEREPASLGIAALFSPQGATVDAPALMEALTQEAKGLGIRYRFGTKVTGIDGKTVSTNQGKIEADHVINCAGLHSDTIAHMMDVGKQYRIIPFRGEYMEVRNCGVRSMIYQAPDLRFPFLSIHLTRETDGRVLAGPSAVPAFGREAYNKEWVWREMPGIFLSRQFIRLFMNPEFVGIAFDNAMVSLSKSAFLRQIQSLVSGVKSDDIIPARAGIRAQMVDSSGKMVNDLVAEYFKDSTHILNAVSPGLTSSLAFAEHVADRILNPQS
ncbi:MAG TPA: L-2-hydroxyglutarate oxidase [Candidatus Omnitrophota bacterium]|nr:L-2-hydroxyglutarate oxidase [Candidatus Omnitrophota bacterium]